MRESSSFLLALDSQTLVAAEGFLPRGILQWQFTRGYLLPQGQKGHVFQ